MARGETRGAQSGGTGGGGEGEDAETLESERYLAAEVAAPLADVFTTPLGPEAERFLQRWVVTGPETG